MATVLILDGLQRKSLAVARWLGAAGHRVLTAEYTWFSLCRFSRYVRRSYVCPDPRRDPAAFLRWLDHLLRREPVDAVIPTDDSTTGALAGAAERFQGRTGLLLPPPSSFQALRDKGETAAWLARAGIPHPRTVVVKDLREVRPAAAQLGLPVRIKARCGAGARGQRVVRRPEDLERVYAEVHREHPWPILQECLTPGPEYHVCLLFDREGRAVARYVERKLRQYPVSGGTSTMQESVDRPDLLALVEPLFRLLPWAGPVEVDVMEDGRTGQPYVLEVNPRYWQSLHVAHRAGVPFAALHLALALGERPPAAPPARPGVRGRALLPFDILAYLSDPHRSRWDPPFFSRYGPDTWDDLLSWSDPGPTLGFLLAAGRFLLDRQMWRAVLRREAGA